MMPAPGCNADHKTNPSCHLYCEYVTEAIARMNSMTLHSIPYGVTACDVSSSQFPWTYYVTPHGSNPGYPHLLWPLCLCGDKGSNLG